MADFYYTDLIGDRTALLNFEQLPDTVKQILYAKIHLWTDRTEEEVANNIKSRLQTKTGRLLSGLNSHVYEAGDRIEGTVYIEGVPYAKAQDTGATIAAHVIRPKTSPVLRFFVNGQKVFAMQVFHPGAILPGVRYMMDAYRAIAPQISSDIKKAIVQGIREHMRAGR